MKKTTFLAAAAALGLAACNSGGTEPNNTVNPPHVPTVMQSVLAHDLTYTQPDSFSVAELAELDQWLSSVDVRYGDRISLDDPNPIGAEARKDLVQRIVGTRGLLVRQHGPVTNPPLPQGVTRVVVVRSTASVPECPDHRRLSNPEVQGSTTSNFSCAMAANMAAMIADPNDLISGKTYSGSVASTEAGDGGSSSDSDGGGFMLVPSSN